MGKLPRRSAEAVEEEKVMSICFFASYKNGSSFNFINVYRNMGAAKVAIANQHEVHPWTVRAVRNKAGHWDVLHCVSYKGCGEWITIGRIEEEPGYE
jgi:hypothetical protein